MTNYAKVAAPYIATANGIAADKLTLDDRAAQTVAIFWLSASVDNPVKDVQKETNAMLKNGMHEDAWRTEKTRVSKAWSACKFIGETIAIAWANGDFSTPLSEAYAMIPRKEREKDSNAVKLAKLMLTMTEEEIEEGMKIYRDALAEAAKQNEANETARQDAIAAIEAKAAA